MYGALDPTILLNRGRATMSVLEEFDVTTSLCESGSPTAGVQVAMQEVSDDASCDVQALRREPDLLDGSVC